VPNQRIPIRDFKGLLTNIDPADKPAEYFSEFKDVRVYPGYLKAEGLDFENADYKLASGEVFVKQQYVFMDGDKFQNEVKNNKLINTYVQNLQKYLFRIIYFNGVYKFKLNDSYLNYELASADSKQYPQIANEKGNLKVFFKEKALWIGRINRNAWNGYKTYNIADNFYVEDMILANNAVANPFIIQTTKQANASYIAVKGKVESKTATWLYEGESYKAIRIGFYSKNLSTSNYTDFVRVPDFGGEISGANGYMIGLVFFNPVLNANVYGFHKKTYDKYFDKGGSSPFTGADVYKVIDRGGDGFTLKNDSRSNSLIHEDFYFFNDNTLDSRFSLTGSYVYNIDRVAVSIDNDSYFSGVNMDVVVTEIVEGNEYPRWYEKIDTDVGEPFVLSISLSGSISKIKRSQGYRIYLRYADTSNLLTSRDFEQLLTYNILSAIPKDFPVFADKLTPNGIFLVQTIGKAYDPETYNIITNPDRYANVGGIPYITYNGNVIYPAVGNGSILNNFYPENVIPGIEGDLIVSFGNLLGVFSAQKELMTLIDFQPVESQMIFYIKDTLGYKVRDKKDFIETTEGTFIHLREGIYVTNGRERTLLSKPINDIIRKYYDTGNIFYNSYLKELYYVSDAGFFCFNFESKAWIEYTSTRFIPSKGILYIAPTSITKVPEDIFVSLNEILDVIEDFKGNIYALTQRRAYKISYKPSEGKLKLDYYDLKDYNYSKAVSSIGLDYNGKVTALDGSITSIQRATGRVYNKLDSRLPYKAISVNLSFTGLLYGLELDLEAFNTEQL